MGKIKLRKKLINDPEIICDSKKMMALLVKYLPEEKLNMIQHYYDCVKLNIVSEMLKTDKYNGEDLDYYANNLYYNGGKKISGKEALDVICGWLEMLEIKRIFDDSGIRYSLFSKKVEELNPDYETKRFFEIANITTVGDILLLDFTKLYSYRKDFYYDFYSVASNISDMISDIEKMETDIYTEDKHPGKNRCELLKKIRKEIAKANKIDFTPNVCHHSGPCMGTCHLCDSEISYLNEEIRKKKYNDEEIHLEGLVDKEIILSGCDVDPNVFCEEGGYNPRFQNPWDGEPKKIRKLYDEYSDKMEKWGNDEDWLDMEEYVFDDDVIDSD